MRVFLFISLLFFSIVELWAQQPAFMGGRKQDTAVVLEQDTLRLPFPISNEKRLTEEDILNKKEGWYVTGLPELTIVPIRGVTVGANAFLFNNRDRRDPFYYYTPYRVRWGMGLRVAQNGRIDGELSVDMPYVFNSKWRLRGDIIYAHDPNWQYFGIGSHTLAPLQYRDRQTGALVSRARFDAYNRNLAFTRPGRAGVAGENPAQTYTDVHYHELDYSQFLVGAAAERTFFEGRMRLMVGLELLLIGIDHYDGALVPGAINAQTGVETEAQQGVTLITEEYRAKERGDADSYWQRYNIGGYNGGRIGLLQTGLMWDTRDLEPDPSSGIFAEYAQEISAPWLGSEFTFTKHLLQATAYQRLLPAHLSRTVLAGRLALGYIRGSNIPFTEVMDLWGSSEGGGIPVLGGARALRGYRESRFVGMVTALANVELRSRFYQTRLFNQHLAFYAVPFFDAGTVWDSFSTATLTNLRANPGLGARIAWNQATILRLDYARSLEDSQFFFVFGHTF
jgi:hypothetical protein